MLNENVKKLLKENMRDLATCSAGVPNVVPVAFKDVTDDGKLVVGDVFLDTTLRNLAANDGRIAVSVYDAKTLEGYQIRGAAEHVTDGPLGSVQALRRGRRCRHGGGRRVHERQRPRCAGGLSRGESRRCGHLRRHWRRRAVGAHGGRHPVLRRRERQRGRGGAGAARRLARL